MIRALALTLTLVTGASGLVYEVAWQKYLATLLGSHSEATAAVLGIFLGGLAAGYAVFGRISARLLEGAGARPGRLLVAYGTVEAGIGLHALVFPLLFRGAQAISVFVPAGAGGVSFALDVALCALLIGPAAVLMGATIPMLTQALASSLEDATRLHARVYALNTAGAFVGALAAGFWLIPSLGLVGVVLAMAAVNLGAGAGYVLLGSRMSARRATTAAKPAASAAAPRNWKLLGAIALLTGFAMMTVQTALIRLGALSLGASQFTFSMVVAVFVLCIALGSFAVGALRRIPRWLLLASLWCLFALLVLLYLEAPDGPYWGHVLRALFRDDPGAFHPYYAAVLIALLGVIGPAVVLSGATLPLLFHELRREFGDLGAMAGRLYSLNTLGSLIGSLVGGYLLLYWLDLHQVFRLALAAIAVATALATVRVVPRPALAFAIAPALIAAFALVRLPDWDVVRLNSGLYRVREPRAGTFEGPRAFFARYRMSPVLYSEDDPTATISVKDVTLPGGPHDLSIVTNGKGDSSVVREYPSSGLLGLVPAFLASRSERAFVVGYGTGVTASELARLQDMREVIVAEISPGVLHAAEHFDFGNGRASRNPKIHVLESDAYRALSRTPGSFDVIASAPSNPWVGGVEMLYTREFLEAARDRLSPGGVHCQWFHTYEVDAETLALVLRTYTSVFEHVELWYGMSGDLLLIGLRDPKLANDTERLVARAARADFSAAFRRTGVNDIAGLFAHQLWPLGVAHAVELPGELHTLMHPRLAAAAARAFFVGQSADLPFAGWPAAARQGLLNGRMLRLAARSGGVLPEFWHERVVSETCRYRPRECLTLLAQWLAEEPHSPALNRVLEQQRGSPELGQSFGLVPSLAGLFSGTNPQAADGLALATTSTDLFLQYFHPAAPFPRELLARLWASCERDPEIRDSCRAARRQAETMMGTIELSGATNLGPLRP